MIKTENQSAAVRGSRDSNDLIPLHEPFDIARLGFDRRQVLDHLESLDGRIVLIAADRDAALTQVAQLSRVLDHLRQQADEATAQVQRILQQPIAQAGARIQRILQLAAEEAAEVKAQAEANQRIRNSELRSLAGVQLLLQVMEENLTDRVAAVQRDESALRELRAQMTSEMTALQSLRAEVTATVTAAHELSTEALAQVRMIPAKPAVGESDTAKQPEIPIQRDGKEETSTAA